MEKFTHWKMNDWLEIDLKTHNGGSYFITNTFTVILQVGTKNSTNISWIAGKQNNSRKKGGKQEWNREDVQATQTNFSCFFIQKGNNF